VSAGSRKVSRSRLRKISEILSQLEGTQMARNNFLNRDTKEEYEYRTTITNTKEDYEYRTTITK